MTVYAYRSLTLIDTQIQVFLKPEELEGNWRLKPENGIGEIKKSTSP
jgi:hypothetical protein